MKIILRIGLILNSNSDRYQLIPLKRYEYISKQIDEIGIKLFQDTEKPNLPSPID